MLSQDYKLKENSKEILLDIGFGDGISLSEDIEKYKDILFIGIEPYKKGFARMVEFFMKKIIQIICFYIICAKDFIKSLECKVKYIVDSFS